MRTLLLALVIVFYYSPALAQKKTADKKFIFANGFMASGIILDVESTYIARDTCILTGKCREWNPLMRPLLEKEKPTMYLVQGAIAGLATYSSYSLKKKGSKIWWLVPVIAGTIHTVVGVNNLRIINKNR